MDAFDILGGPNLRGRGRPRIREPTNNNNRPVGRPKMYGDLSLQERMRLAQKKFQDKKKEKRKKDTLRLQDLKIKEEQAKIINREQSKQLQKQQQTIKRNQKYINKTQNEKVKLKSLKPSKSSFKSYDEYTIKNDYPEMIPIHHLSESLVQLLAIEDKLDKSVIPEEDIEAFLDFYNVETFLKTKQGFKAYLSMQFLTAIKKEKFRIEEKGITSKSFLIRNEYNVYDILKSLKETYSMFSDQGYTFPFQLQKLHLSCQFKIVMMKTR